VTCPTLLLRRSDVVAELLAALERPLGTVRRLTDALRSRDEVAPQLGRFFLAGMVSNVLYAVVFLGLAPFGDQPANSAAVLASSALANELHRRLTFHAGERVGWLAAQWAGGGTALVGWLASSSALALLATSGPASPAVQVLLVLSVTAAVGLARFAALRWVWRPRALHA
jgi:hypothetical protein